MFEVSGFLGARSKTKPQMAAPQNTVQPAPAAANINQPASPSPSPDAAGQRNLQDIYGQLDRIRQDQIALATDHVNLTTLQAEGLSLADMVGLDSAKYQRNNEKFAKKEADVGALMEKVRSRALKALLTRF
jgi:hypothetical protein